MNLLSSILGNLNGIFGGVLLVLVAYLGMRFRSTQNERNRLKSEVQRGKDNKATENLENYIEELDKEIEELKKRKEVKRDAIYIKRTPGADN